MKIFSKVPPPMVRMQVLSAIDYAEGKTQRDRYKTVSQKTFMDQETGKSYRFTWRTIETWVVRHKKHGMAVLDKKARLATEPQVQFVGVPSGEVDPESLDSDLKYAIEDILAEQNSRTLQSDDALRNALQR